MNCVRVDYPKQGEVTHEDGVEHVVSVLSGPHAARYCRLMRTIDSIEARVCREDLFERFAAAVTGQPVKLDCPGGNLVGKNISGRIFFLLSGLARAVALTINRLFIVRPLDRHLRAAREGEARCVMSWREYRERSRTARTSSTEP